MSDQTGSAVVTSVTADSGVSVSEDAPVAPQVEVEPTVTPTEALAALKGENDTVTVRDQKFRVVTNLPGIVLLDLGVAADPSATQAEQLRALREFIKAAVHADDAGKFENLLRTAQPIIDIGELNDIVADLLAVVGGRPTE